MSDRTAPESQLRLEWVYGYRGHQCRNNVHYTSTGRGGSGNIVYFVAGVAIVYSIRQHSQKFFLGHDDDILSLCLHPDNTLVATGQVGRAPYICVWDSSSMKTISYLKDQHQHGIGSMCFDKEGSRLVSVGTDPHSTINVWDWKKGKVLASARGHNDRVFDIQFNLFQENEIVSCGVKHIKFWTLCGNSLQSRKGVFGKVGEIQTQLCLAFGPNQTTYSGTLSGDIYVWCGSNLQNVIPDAHEGPIYTLYMSEEGYASGGKDGTIKLWDGNFKPITTINMTTIQNGYKGLSIRSVCWKGEMVLVGTKDGEIFEVSVHDRNKPRCLVQGHAEGELWALAIHPKKPIFATGSDDQTLRFCNMNNFELLSKTTLDHKIRSCSFDNDGGHIAVGFDDGSFAVLKSRDLSEVVHIKDRKEVLHEMKYSPCGKFLAVASNDNFVDIYSIEQRYKKVGVCSGNSSFITHIDWSIDSKFLQTNSGAAERLFYRMPTGKHTTNRDEIANIKWASFTGVLGDEVSGIWEKYTDTNDINAVDANFDGQVIVTGDDFGLVKLFRYPCLRKGSKFRKYNGHSAHVTNVRFSHDKQWVITIGGADHAVFQWKLLPPGLINADGDVQPQHVANSNSEDSDSDLSEVADLDSDLEVEKQVTYDRRVYQEDAAVLKKLSRNDMKPGEKRQGGPDRGLRLEYVYGYRGYDCRNNIFYTKTGNIVYHIAAVGIVLNRETNVQRLYLGHTDDILCLYRGYDCRNNIFYTKTGNIVYHIAAVGIVLNRETNVQRLYLGHTDDILCLCIHPLKDIVATGQVGRDPMIHIWDVDTMKSMSVLKGHHERGICAVDFSADGKKLASVGLDDSHTIVVWDWKRGEKLANTKGHKDKIFVIKWNPIDNNQIVTTGVKHIKFWTQTGGGFTSKRGIFGKTSKMCDMLCIAFGKSVDCCYSGGSDGNVFHWVGTNLQKTVKAHNGPCFAMHSLEKGFVTGGKDGNVSLWDGEFEQCLRTYAIKRASFTQGSRGILIEDSPPVRTVVLGHGKILVGTKNGEILEIEKEGPMFMLTQGHKMGEVWGLDTLPSNDLCVTVSDDKTLRVWTTSGEHKMVSYKVLKGAARCVSSSPDGKALAVGFKDGSFEVFSFDSMNEIASFHHRKEEISDIKFSPAPGKYLAVASHDNFVDIYNVLSNKRVGTCKGSSSYITHIDWDQQGKVIMVNTGAKEQLFFEAPRGKRFNLRQAEIEKLQWASWTCVLGGTCEGIWPSKSDITDINATSLSNDKQLLATADDFGLLKVFQFPVKGRFAKFKKYNGHSAHVTNVRWCHDDQKLVTVGGADMSVMIWASNNPAGKTTTCRGESDDSDTDSEEEGYDSDVEREKKIDYTSKIYAESLQRRDGVKPNQQLSNGNILNGPTISRNLNPPPKLQANEMNQSGKKKKPTKISDLVLDHVYGYRGFDTRNNLHFLDDINDIAFHTAGVGVIQNISSGTQSFYIHHTDDIICLTINQHPKFKNIIASGQLGQPPCIHIWDAYSKETLSILEGVHEKGVCSVDFSSSGRYLVSVGLGEKHRIAIWKWQEGMLMASIDGHTDRIFRVEFRPDSDQQLVSVGIKHVKFWSVAGSQILGKKGILTAAGTGGSICKMQTMLSLAFGNNNITFTGTLSGDVYVWQGNTLQRLVVKAHTGPIFCMYTTLKDGLLLTGGKEYISTENGPVKLWDQEMKRCRAYPLPDDGMKTNVVKSVCRSKGKILVGTITNTIFEIAEKSGGAKVILQSHGEGEVWGLDVHPKGISFVTASLDGSVRLWDLSMKCLQYKLSVGPACSVSFSCDGDLIAVGLKNGEFLILTTDGLKLWGRKRDRSGAINDIRFSPDGKYLAVGSESKCVDFYDLSSGSSLSRSGFCKGIPSFVIQMDFSANAQYIKVGTGAYIEQVFSVPTGKLIDNDHTINSITWLTWTSVLSKEVLGIWPENADKADVNCCHLSPQSKSLATGDDFGYVKLFQFPCPEKYAPFKNFVGHSAHVTNVRFTPNEKYLISTGGDDCSIFVWKCQ